MTKVKNGDTVSLHYTGKLEDGSIFDSSLNEGREPLKAKLGEGMLIPGFESGIIDMMVGDKKTIEIEPENAYGPFLTERTFEIPLNQVPPGATVGEFLTGSAPDGSAIQVKILEVKEDSVVLDANHPLAGKKLIFELELLEIA